MYREGDWVLCEGCAKVRLPHFCSPDHSDICGIAIDTNALSRFSMSAFNMQIYALLILYAF